MDASVPIVNTLPAPELTVRRFYGFTRESLGLEIVAGASGLGRTIEEAVMHRPGLVLTGFYEFFANRRIQVFGRAERTYLAALGRAERTQRWSEIFRRDVPCVILCGNLGESPGADVLEMADRYGVPIFVSREKTLGIITRGTLMLHELTAPTASIHGTLVDVGGIGVLLTGAPGIGKSETALGLVRQGNALIADDMTLITVDAHGVLHGTAPAQMRGFMEIRGLGLLHIPTLYGIAAVKQDSRLDLIVSLKRCNDEDDIDRTGADVRTFTILDRRIQYLTVPVAAGRDFVNVVETAAAAFKMRHSGIDAAAILDKQIVAHNKNSVEQNYG